MKIIRIDMGKGMSTKVDSIEIEINGTKYCLTENFGKLNIHTDGRLAINPCVSNVVEIYNDRLGE